MALNENQQERMELVKKLVNDSPFYRHIGMKFISYDEGVAVVEVPFSATVHANVYGTAHGGAIASAADSACGLALATLLEVGQSAVTIDLRVSYLAPFDGGVLTARGEVVHKGRINAIESAKLTQGDKLVAIATAIHYIKSPSK